jgi:lactate permease
MFKQIFDPVNHSLGESSLFAVLPLLVLFLLLGVFNVRAHWAALAALATSIVVAVFVYSMPFGQTADSAFEGAVFGLFPIMWIVVNAIWIYTMTVKTGHFDVLRRSFARVSDDHRVQAIIIAFCFGALLEALAGFGTPVAITSVMLVALGLKPFKAAAVALVANTAPVAFGAIAVPITTLATVSGLPVHVVGSMVGRQTPLLAIFVPLVLVFIVGGRRGLRETWPVALICGVAFAVAQYVMSNFISIQLTDIVAALVAAGAVVVTLRFWSPAAGEGRLGGAVVRGEALREGPGAAVRRDTRADVARAYAPYVIIVAVFGVAQLGLISDLLAKTTRKFSWPGLHVVGATGKPLSLETFTLNWLPAAGSLLLIAGVLTMVALRVGVLDAVRAYGQTVRQLRWAILTVVCVLALAYVMNLSAETITLGKWVAGAGGVFALLSPVLGWLGVAVTGSDTSSNSLFGALQVTAAKSAHLSPTLLAAANSSGGVLGKMISPQNLAIGASAVGLQGQEGKLFRSVAGWSLLFLAVMCLLVFLQSTVLSGMVPS